MNDFRHYIKPADIDDCKEEADYLVCSKYSFTSAYTFGPYMQMRYTKHEYWGVLGEFWETNIIKSKTPMKNQAPHSAE